MSGDFGPSRIWPRMSVARETGREEKASMFHDMRESLCAQKVSMFGDVRESLCITWLCAFLKGMGAHLRVERLKTERVRESLSVTMADWQMRVPSNTWVVGQRFISGYCDNNESYSIVRKSKMKNVSSLIATV